MSAPIPPTPGLLAETLGRTLEEAAFVFAEPADPPPPFPAEELLEARVGFRGPRSGELCLVADPTLAATLAANLLGEDVGEAAAARARDAVGELLNLVVGALVVRIFGAEASCRLGVPRVRRITPAEHGIDLSRARCAASLVEEDGRRIDLALAAEAG